MVKKKPLKKTKSSEKGVSRKIVRSMTKPKKTKSKSEDVLHRIKKSVVKKSTSK